MRIRGWMLLLLAASVSFLIAILHVVIVLIGPSAYIFFGGERLPRLALSGSSSPAIQTLFLAVVHAVFGPARQMSWVVAHLSPREGESLFREFGGHAAFEEQFEPLAQAPLGALGGGPWGV